MKYKNGSDVFNVYDTLEQNGQPSFLDKISVISFNVVFLKVCGALIFIAKKFIKSIPPGRKLVCIYISKFQVSRYFFPGNFGCAVYLSECLFCDSNDSPHNHIDEDYLF